MKIIVTGSLGNIGRPLVKTLVQDGHSVVVISQDPEKENHIEALGAKAAIGTLHDEDFLVETFKGADVVYAMKPPFDIFDKSLDVDAFYRRIGLNYKNAILHSGVKNLLHLSSVGAHSDQGVGMLRFHHEVENILSSLPNEVDIKFIRPMAFFTNLFGFIPMIKAQGAIFQNYGGDDKIPWVSPLDIAATIAEEINLPFNGRQVRYVTSDEVSPNQIAKALGNAIGKPNLLWIKVTDEQFLDSLVQVGMSRSIAKGWVDALASISQVNGVLYEDYFERKPVFGKVKLEDFVKEFAIAFSA